MTVVLIAAAVVGLFVLLNFLTARRHAAFTIEDVEDALNEAISPAARDHDTWDLFLGHRIDDTYLESIRQQCIRIVDECPRTGGTDLGEEGDRRVAALLADLRRKMQEKADSVADRHV